MYMEYIYNFKSRNGKRRNFLTSGLSEKVLSYVRDPTSLETAELYVL